MKYHKFEIKMSRGKKGARRMRIVKELGLEEGTKIKLFSRKLFNFIT